MIIKWQASEVQYSENDTILIHHPDTPAPAKIPKYPKVRDGSDKTIKYWTVGVFIKDDQIIAESSIAFKSGVIGVHLNLYKEGSHSNPLLQWFAILGLQQSSTNGRVSGHYATPSVPAKDSTMAWTRQTRNLRESVAMGVFNASVNAAHDMIEKKQIEKAILIGSAELLSHNKG